MTNAADHAAQLIRCAGREALAAGLLDARQRLLRVWRAFDRALADKAWQVRYLPELNPPLWELGHVAWFEEFWIARNPQRHRGAAADPDVARAAAILPRADALYHSSQVAHARRWHLDLPSAARSLQYAAQVRERTLALLAQAATDDDALYFYRLVLHHEDMHREAWLNMAQTLGLPLTADIEADFDKPSLASSDGEWTVPAQTVNLGSAPGASGGFAFDNEYGTHAVAVETFAIDRNPVSWARYLPFIEAGGYDERRWWTPEGWAWRQAQGLRRPRHLAPADDTGAQPRDAGWKQAMFGQWTNVEPEAPATHISAHEAQAWCQWAGRRLPSEAEWQAAASAAAHDDQVFSWGHVWEWTATPFAPYPGFTPHPYRDYSQPWFDGRPVLRGGSFAAAARLKSIHYRNFYTADRNDIFAGFRSCART